MPFSSLEGKKEAVAMVQTHCHGIKKVLDVGAGCGTWHQYLAPELPGSVWDAIEVWEPYVEQFQLRDKYHRVLVADASTQDWRLGHYDLAIFGDVLEHMEIPRAHQMLRWLDWEYALLSIPMAGGLWEHQEPWEGNPWEEHLSSWTPDDVAAVFPPLCSRVLENMGIFLLRR